MELTEALSGATVVTVENPTTLRIFRTESDRSSPLYFTVRDGVWYLSRSTSPATALTASTSQARDVSLQVRELSNGIRLLTVSFWLGRLPFYFSSYVYPY